MVKQTEKGFLCEECKMQYKEKTLAQKCEKWCFEHNSCNLEIIKQAIK